MPPRKRASQTSKHESPTASTSHVSSDQHHHLRHTGPSIGTRFGAGATPSKPSPASAERAPTPENPPNEKNPQGEKPTAKVSPPGARTSFAKFIYVLLLFLLLFLGWYIWGIVVFFEQLKKEVGWWGIVAGDSGGTARWRSSGLGFGSGSERSEGELEASLEGLANALGVSPVQVASALKPLVPQASLASIASKMEGMGASEAARVLFEDPSDHQRTSTVS